MAVPRNISAASSELISSSTLPLPREDERTRGCFRGEAGVSRRAAKGEDTAAATWRVRFKGVRRGVGSAATIVSGLVVLGAVFSWRGSSAGRGGLCCGVDILFVHAAAAAAAEGRDEVVYERGVVCL